jgi:polysaccharide biosynthesis protein PslH
MSYYPNADGILEFLRMAWPRIRREFPTAECYIVGASPGRAVKRFDGQDGIHVTGRVPDVQAYLQQAWVFIVPLRIGGGIRLKILEAMAAGAPIVSTHIGCEGLDGKHGKHLMIEDHFEDFADAVTELIGDREKRDHLRDCARALVEEQYDWDRVIERQQSLYCSLVQEWVAVAHPLR